ncbi:ABC transporter substrate-binding protein [Anaerobacillus sp. MEB173]|uniref:ABC transporter substrate-binding protein n=1 Tax=Anaerobacillus sp. MEB173 TaxID=3383345 RepID=UPI003F916303
MKKLKLSALFMIFVIAVAMMAACGSNSVSKEETESVPEVTEQEEVQEVEISEEVTEGEGQTYKFLTPKGAPALPGLIVSEEGFGNHQLELETWDQLEQLLAHLQNGDADFVAAPINVASNLVSKGLPLQLIHVNTWGTIFLVTIDENVNSLADLQGEQLYVSHKSGPPDVLTNFLLEEEGIKDSVEIQYATPPEIAQMLIGGKIKHAVLPEPVLSGVRLNLKEQLKEVVDFQATWNEMYGQDLPQAGIVVNKEFASENADVIEAFQQAYGEAIERMYENPDEIATLAETHLDLKAPIVKSSLNKMVIKLVEAEEAQFSIEQYFNLLLESQPESIGGQLPDEGFYYKR